MTPAMRIRITRKKMLGLVPRRELEKVIGLSVIEDMTMTMTTPMGRAELEQLILAKWDDDDETSYEIGVIVRHIVEKALKD